MASCFFWRGEGGGDDLVWAVNLFLWVGLVGDGGCVLFCFVLI